MSGRLGGCVGRAKPHTEYLAHEDGHWIAYTLESFEQRALGHRHWRGQGRVTSIAASLYRYAS
jgi:hypothetical protein